MQLLLGSKSPRRRELLAGLGLPFEIVAIDADESYPSHLQGEEIPLYLSRAKAQAYSSPLAPNQVLITADTIVWLDGQVFGKPHDLDDAKRMLALLSGHTHQVYTGVTILTADHPEGYSFTDRTDVTFRTLTEAEIDYYVEHFRPLDKAGAYGIQEWIGYIGCTRLNGSYFNVMGLPTEPLYAAIQQLQQQQR